MSRTHDILGVIRGLQAVAQAGLKVQEDKWKIVWDNSSIKILTNEYLTNVTNPSKTPVKNVNEIFELVNDGSSRLSAVFDGVKEYFNYATGSASKVSGTGDVKSYSIEPNTDGVTQKQTDAKLERVFHPSDFELKLTASDKALLKKLDKEHREKLKAAALTYEETEITMEPLPAAVPKTDQVRNKPKTEDVKIKAEPVVTKPVAEKITEKPKVNKDIKPKVMAVPNPKSRQKLCESAKQRTVPSSRIGRMLSFGSLAAGLGLGTAAEYARQTFGLKDRSMTENAFLSEANMDRIVDTLCKVRGAALKIGQMLSIQDESLVNPKLAKALERVRKSADFMPTWQVKQVLRTELGENWRYQLSEFDEKPFAAASIGQVHWGKTLEGQEVAIKIQYPGVAKGIESDIDNLVGIMNLWDIFPKGMFIDNVVTVAKRELAWEVDYKREAECTKKFKELLKPYPYFYVPEVIDGLCSSQVFTTELLEGMPVDQCINLDLETRKFIAMKVMELCLRELMEFRYMQTDPNWANFFYNPNTKQVLLLDFGASREYSKYFMDRYVRIIKAASENDRQTVLNISKELGFFTGYESKIMEEAHVDAVMILGEVFRCPGEFDFAVQDTILKIQNLVPIMLAHRLCPPPEEIYSIHRKISGVFLLCSKLKVSIAVKPLFVEIYNQYKFDT